MEKKYTSKKTIQHFRAKSLHVTLLENESKPVPNLVIEVEIDWMIVKLFSSKQGEWNFCFSAETS